MNPNIIPLAIGYGVFCLMAFNFFWSVLPDAILRRIDFKPFNCFVCFTGWTTLIFGLFYFDLLNAIAFAGFSVIASYGFNKLF